MSISSPLKSIIVNQLDTIPDAQLVKDIKNEKKRQKEKDLNDKVQHIDENLAPERKKAVEDTRATRGVSSWISVLPLSAYGFALNKGEFRDTLKLRYGKENRVVCHHIVHVDRNLTQTMLWTVKKGDLSTFDTTFSVTSRLAFLQRHIKMLKPNQSFNQLKENSLTGSQVKTPDQTSEREGSGVQDRMFTSTFESTTNSKSQVNNDTMKTLETRT